MSTDRNTPEEPAEISEYLDRMSSDAASIHKQLMEAPVLLIGKAEPALYDVLVQIRRLLVKAQEIWPSQSQTTRLIGWLKQASGNTPLTIIRHSDLSAENHRPHYPASLDPKNTRSFNIFSFLDQTLNPEKFKGCPVYFRIEKTGEEEQAADVEIISPEDYESLGVSKIC